MNKSFRKDRKTQPSTSVRSQVGEADRRRQLPFPNKRSMRPNQLGGIGSPFPFLTQLPLHLWLLLAIILLLFLTNHLAVSDLILLLKLIKAW